MVYVTDYICFMVYIKNLYAIVVHYCLTNTFLNKYMEMLQRNVTYRNTTKGNIYMLPLSCSLVYSEARPSHKKFNMY
jgi:hypothetical protein